MNSWKILGSTILVTIVCIYISILLYPKVHPLYAIDLSVDKSVIIAKAQKILESQGLSAQGYHSDMQLESQDALIHQVHETRGLEDGNVLLRTSIPGYYWKFKWQKQEYRFALGGDEDTTRTQKQWDLIERLEFKFDLRGNLLQYTRTISDTMNLPNLSFQEMKDLAYNFVQMNTDFTLIETESLYPDTGLDQAGDKFDSGVDQIQDIIKRAEYNFQWYCYLTGIENKINIDVKVKGNLISSFNVEFNVPEIYDDESMDHLIDILFVLFYLIISIIAVIVAFKKSRAYEISFRLAWKLGVFVALIYSLDFYYILSREEIGWVMIIPLIAAPSMLGGIFIIFWAVSESVGREAWRDKFIPLDLITKGHLMHSRIGEGILRGITFASVTFLMMLGFTWLAAKGFTISTMVSNQSILEFFGSLNPILKLTSHSIWANLYILVINCVFVVSIIYNKTGNRGITIVLASILLAITMGGNIKPFYIGIIIESLALGIIIWSFFRHDILTAFTSLMFYMILNVSIVFAQPAYSSFENSLCGLSFFVAGLIIYAIATIFTKDSVKDFSSIEPVIAKFISERQRMQQQLEVAREVQKTFLPQSYPIFKGLEIAASCEPALEVGGDYYDFVKLDSHRLGVAIGDVSGKGTRAAFYMTLVKGFLKALALRSPSPAEMLKELNILFFENAKRDAFISMVYGVFDMKEKILTIARSGHNPVIVHHTLENKIDTIKTDGLALGLEKGDLFNRIMQESRIPLHSGDLFVFYTDGFTEARNKKNEEFGEERFLKSIKEYSEKSAELVLKNIFTEVRRFSKGATQHDDMSMVVVKVL